MLYRCYHVAHFVEVGVEGMSMMTLTEKLESEGQMAKNNGSC